MEFSAASSSDNRRGSLGEVDPDLNVAHGKEELDLPSLALQENSRKRSFWVKVKQIGVKALPGKGRSSPKSARSAKLKKKAERGASPGGGNLMKRLRNEDDKIPKQHKSSFSEAIDKGEAGAHRIVRHKNRKASEFSGLLGGLRILKNFRKNCRSKRLQKEFLGLVEEKINEGNLEDELKKMLDVDKDEEEIESEWKKLIVRDDKADSYDIEYVEALNFKSALRSLHFAPRKGALWKLSHLAIFIESCLKISAQSLLQNRVFKLISVGMIVYNCVKIATHDHFNDKNEYDDFAILTFFLFEMLVTMTANGLLTFKRGYFRSGWNISEFLVNLLTVIFRVFLPKVDLDFGAFRALRILRFIEWESFQLKLYSLLSAFPYLIGTFQIVVYFQLIFALVGMNLFAGVLKYRCIDPATGKTGEDELTCGYKACPSGLVCAKTLTNPEWDTVNYDTFLFSLMQVIRVLAAENWSYAVKQVYRSVSAYFFPFFALIIVLVNYVILNLIIAVLKVKYSEVHSMEFSEIEKDSNFQVRLNLRHMKAEGYCPHKYKSNEGHLPKLGIFRKNLNLAQKQDVKTAKPSIYNLFGIQRHLSKRSTNQLLERYSSLRKKTLNERLLVIQKRLFTREKAKLSGAIDYAAPSRGTKEKDSPTQRKENKARFLEVLQRNYQLFPFEVSFILRKLKIPINEMFRELKAKKIFLAHFEIQIPFGKRFESASEEDVLDEDERNVLKQNILMRRLQKEDFRLKVFYDINDENLNEAQPEVSEKSAPAPRLRSLKSTALKLPVAEPKVRLRLGDSPEKKFEKKKTVLAQKSVGYPKLSVTSSPNLSPSSKKRKAMMPTIFSAFKAPGYNELREKIMEEIEPDPQPEGEPPNITAYFSIREADFKEKKIKKNVWSGGAVLKTSKPHESLERLFNTLNVRNTNIWLKGKKGTIKHIRKVMKEIFNSHIYRLLFTGMVLINILELSLIGIIEEDQLVLFHIILGTLFLLEILYRLLALGIKGFFHSIYNLMDLSFVTYMVTDTVFHKVIDQYGENNDNSGFLNAFKMLEAILVFRMYYFLVKINYMKVILSVIRRTLPSFIVVAFLFLFALIVYALFGMQLFKERFDLSTLEGREKNFDTFWWALVSAFKVAIFDDSYVFVMLGFKEVGPTVSFLYVLLGIYLLNFILLKLFCAVMLDGFESKNEDISDDDEEPEAAKDDSGDTLANRSLNFRKLSQDDEEASFTNYQKQKLLKLNGGFAEQSDGMSRSRKSDITSSAYESEDTPLHREVARNMIGKVPGQRRNSVSEKFDFQLPKPAEFVYFKDVATNHALCFFSKKNKFRKLCYRIVVHKLFFACLLTMVLLSCLNLSFETFIHDVQYAHLKDFSQVLNGIINSFFLLEGFLMIVAYGLVWQKGSYLRDLFNALDFAASLFFLLDLMTDDEIYPAFRSLNLLRIFRPLSMISIKNNLKHFVITIGKSLNEILNVLLIVIIVWIFFALMGMYLFRQKLGYCEDQFNFHVARSQCPPDKWIVHPNNFDTLYDSLYFLLVLSSFDGWGPLLAVTANGDLEDHGPSYQVNQYSAFIFFFLFCIVGTWFFLNLFIGVIFSNFLLAQRLSRHKFFSEPQVAWTKMLSECAKLKILFRPAPESNLRKLAFSILHHNIFKKLMLLAHFESLLMLITYYDTADATYKAGLDYTSLGVFILYSIEASLRMVAYRPLNYFTRASNIYEFVSLCAYFLYSFSVHVYNFNNEYSFRIIRATRVLSVARLLKEIQDLESVTLTLKHTLPLLSNVFCLGLVITFCYAIVGYALFHEVRHGDVIDEYTNFRNVGTAMMSLFRCSTSDDWNPMMFDCFKYQEDCSKDQTCGSRWSPLFFISYIVIINHILVNIFILMVLGQFENLYKNPKNPLRVFKSEAKLFERIWTYFSCDDNKKQMELKVLPSFLRAYDSELGVPRDFSTWQIGKFIMELKLICEDNRIYYNEVYYVLLRRHFYKEIFEESNLRALHELNRLERKFYYNLEELKAQEACNIEYQKQKNTAIKINIHMMKNSNLLPSFFAAHLCFASWKNATRQGVLKERSSQKIQVKESHQGVPETEKIRVKLFFEQGEGLPNLLLN